ncbi:MAG: hypothetical protein LBD60_02350 [Puniceicoccales bacterium]|nr:hypothetical protein [Puniceicoccales bacterium]
MGKIAQFFDERCIGDHLLKSTGFSKRVEISAITNEGIVNVDKNKSFRRYRRRNFVREYRFQYFIEAGTYPLGRVSCEYCIGGIAVVSESVAENNVRVANIINLQLLRDLLMV